MIMIMIMIQFPCTALAILILRSGLPFVMYLTARSIYLSRGMLSSPDIDICLISRTTVKVSRALYSDGIWISKKGA